MRKVLQERIYVLKIHQVTHRKKGNVTCNGIKKGSSLEIEILMENSRYHDLLFPRATHMSYPYKSVASNHRK